MSETRNKTLMLKDTIYQLYVVEGKSLNSISKLLFLSRKEMTDIIKNEFGFEKGNIRQPTVRIQKLLNTYKDSLLSLIENTDSKTLNSCYESLGITNNLFRTLCDNDKELEKARISFNAQESDRQKRLRKRKEREDAWIEDVNSIDGEVWKDIVGYEGRYQISNFARVKSLIVSPRILIKEFNEKIGRYQIILSDSNGKTKAHKVYRLVAYAFVENDNVSEKTTVNHKDGDCTNDLPYNLEWSTQKYQNWHKNEILKRKIAEPYKKNGKFTHVIIDDKYTFKTIAAAARFIGVSETQFQRYISGISKTDRKIELKY